MHILTITDGYSIETLISDSKASLEATLRRRHDNLTEDGSDPDSADYDTIYSEEGEMICSMDISEMTGPFALVSTNDEDIRVECFDTEDAAREEMSRRYSEIDTADDGCSYIGERSAEAHTGETILLWEIASN